jgi:hypothetical protein
MAELTTITTASGIDYAKILTSQPFTQALGEFLDARTRSTKGR